MDIKKLMAEAQKMQQDLTTKLREFDEKLFSFDYKQLIKIEIFGSLKIKSLIIIEKSLIDQKDQETLEDIIIQATNSAIDAVSQGKSELTNKIAGPGLDGLL